MMCTDQPDRLSSAALLEAELSALSLVAPEAQASQQRARPSFLMPTSSTIVRLVEASVLIVELTVTAVPLNTSHATTLHYSTPESMRRAHQFLSMSGY